MSCYEKILQERLDERTESLRQAVASIDRLTLERAQLRARQDREAINRAVALRDAKATAESPDYPLEQYKTTIGRLKDDIVKYQRKIEELEKQSPAIEDLRVMNNALYDEKMELRAANKALSQEIVALKARTLAAPNDQEDMAILGRFFRRLVNHDRVRVSLEKIATDCRSWVRVEPSPHWSCNRYPSDSHLGQILLGLKK